MGPLPPENSDMEPKTPGVAGFHLLGVAVLLLATPAAIFWRPHLPFFYILDDWTALIQMTQYPFWQYLGAPDGEQWFPFFHLIFYGLVRIAGEHYSLLALVNCLGTGINAFLLFLFLQRHFSSGLALLLSLVYAGQTVHHAIAWNAFYLSYVLSLGFFLGALLLTDGYLHSPRFFRLLGIGLCALLSILSHNYTLLGLWALPLYVVLLGGSEGRSRFWPLASTVGLVYLAFGLGYYRFAGLSSAASHNLTIFSSLPGPAYLAHIFLAAIISPFLYLFWGHYHFPPWAYVAGLMLLAVSLTAIWWRGGPAEKRLAFWALLVNVLPFFLISLTRYQRSLNQAFVARYGIFTLLVAIILVGLAWRVLAARLPQRLWFHLVTLALVLAMAAGQFFSLPLWQKKYLDMSRAAMICYQQLKHGEGGPGVAAAELYRQFCPTAHPVLTSSQVGAIGRFLSGTPKDP